MVNIRQFIGEAISRYAKRNLWKVFGYPITINVDQYWLRYRRDGIGSRIIRAYPDACWRGKPQLFDEQGTSPDPESKEYSPFAEAWCDLDHDTGALSYLHRLDRLSRVGHYAVLVLGFDDGDRLSEPLEGEHELIYMAPYAERSAQIVQWDTDPQSPRYALPVMYEINPLQDRQNTNSRNISRLSFRVHHSRVIHAAENTDENDVFGEPALRPVWNYLMDLEKVLGSGAETFWLNARGGLSVEAQADAKLGTDAVADMKQQMEDYENELRRTLALQGASVKAINIAMADPKSNVEVNMQMICGTTGIPQRLFSGSERGELASSEDANSFEARVDERVQDYCEPCLLRPFVNRMIETGNLPQPVGNWGADWAEAAEMSPAKQAEIANTRITAASTWANGFADRVLSKEEVRLMMGLEAESKFDMEDEEEDADTLAAEDDPDAATGDPTGGGDDV